MEKHELYVSRNVYEKALKEIRDLKRQIKKERKQAYREGYQQAIQDERSVHIPFAN